MTQDLTRFFHWSEQHLAPAWGICAHYIILMTSSFVQALLTHWGLNEMAATLRKTFSNAISWMNITVTSRWLRRRLKSPASWSFTQPFVEAQIKETSKLRVTGHCEENSPVTGEFPTQRASNAENISIWWRHHWICIFKDHRSLFFVDPNGNMSALAGRWQLDTEQATSHYLIQSWPDLWRHITSPALNELTLYLQNSENS